MTTSSSDHARLRHGSISSASAPHVHQSSSHQRSRHVQSRLTIIPLPSSPVQQSDNKFPRTSFSASSFARRHSVPDLRAYSHPLNPQEIYDLAAASLEPSPPEIKEVTAPTDDTVSGGKSVVPKAKFTPLAPGSYLPFIDRPSEVTRLLKHPANASTLTLIELIFSYEKQQSDFHRLLFHASREEVNDMEWISTIRSILKPRSEILWTRLKIILGVPPELDDDDRQLRMTSHIDELSSVSAIASAQLLLPDQSPRTQRLPAPAYSSEGYVQSPDATPPIIEEVESTDSIFSMDKQERKFDPAEAAALCFQTAPLFIPGANSTTEHRPKPATGLVDDQFGRQRRRPKGQTHISLRHPSSQRPSKFLRPAINKSPNRARSPLSGSVVTSQEDVSTKSEADSEKLEKGGDESDVPSASSTSLDDRKGSVEENNYIMTGTGDTMRPRKPSLRPKRPSDAPLRDILPINVPIAFGAPHENGQGERKLENHLDKSASPSPEPRRSSVCRNKSASLSTISLAENAFADHPTVTSPVVKGRPRFPASFRKSPVSSQPCAISRHAPSQSGCGDLATDGSAIKQRAAGHPRSHTMSSVSTRPPQRTCVGGSPLPPPPTPVTPRTSSGSSSPHAGPSTGLGTHVSPCRAASLIQRHPHSPSLSFTPEVGMKEEEEDAGKSCFEVEGLKGSVRDTSNPLLKHSPSESVGYRSE